MERSVSNRSDENPVEPVRRSWVLKVGFGVLALVVVGVLALLGYRQFFLADAAAPLELGERAGGDSVDDPADSRPVATTAPADTARVDADMLESSRWVTGTDSIVGYRVDEVVAGVLDETVAGRTSDVVGSVEIVGSRVVAADFVVDMTTLDSGSSARDAALRRSELNTDEFPDAEFELAGEIPLDSEDPSTVVERTVDGVLTLRGETRDVEVDLEARIVEGEMQILGLVPIDFDLFEIPLDPPGVSLENTQVEFSLILQEAP